jgi:hypothetical protein
MKNKTRLLDWLGMSQWGIHCSKNYHCLFEMSLHYREGICQLLFCHYKFHSSKHCKHSEKLCFETTPKYNSNRSLRL